ncbi:DDB1- and CUL4-associated factor 8 isoform X1 [Drosophila busckii]|uniref:DDB1- and CUL4-associated factor 8 isoform X1 n=1 Tax=Drosophila busckii TaxID=30019 RepID=UPI001432BF6C|nr:DDB1- and CUL4-associated factor 8 isoform X1 [Drosophila busckii]
MDIDDDQNVQTCKRQKRNNSKDDNRSGDDNEETTAAAPPTVAEVNPTVANRWHMQKEKSVESINSDNKNNKNNNNSTKSDAVDNLSEGQQEEEEAKQQEAASLPMATTTVDADEATDPNVATSSTASGVQFDEQAINVQTEPVVRVEDDSQSSQSDDVGESPVVFNRHRIPSTRSYRSPFSPSMQRRISSPFPFIDHTLSTDEDSDFEPRQIIPLESSSDSNDSLLLGHSNDTSYSDNGDNEPTDNVADKEQVESAVNNVLCKNKPVYSWNLTQQLIQREHNISNRINWRGGHSASSSFGQGYYASRQAVEQLTMLSKLSRHRGCVNCLNFNRAGDLVCSGSDDLNIIVWDWANKRPRHSFKSGHSLNIFQSKFIDSSGCLDIVTTSRDGQVRRTVIPPSGSESVRHHPIRLYSHSEAVHKLVVVPQSRNEIMTAGEDAAVKHFDLRSNQFTLMLRCLSDGRRVRLFSVAHHPFAQEFCVSGSDDKLRIYDKRKPSHLVHELVPKDIQDKRISQITCCVYNHSGSEILATYSDAGIYLFDSRNYQVGEYLHSYGGHVNSRTIKGVNFFGPHSEYIISGSDCGNIFFWDKNTEAVINLIKGDTGVVNCLEQHPSMPVLASSGLEHNVKIWTPCGSAEAAETRAKDLKETLRKNFRRSILDVGELDISQIHYFIRQLIDPRPSRHARGMAAFERNAAMFDTLSTSSSSSTNSSPSNHSSGNSSNNSPAGPDPAEGRLDEATAEMLGCRQQ